MRDIQAAHIPAPTMMQEEIESAVRHSLSGELRKRPVTITHKMFLDETSLKSLWSEIVDALAFLVAMKISSSYPDGRFEHVEGIEFWRTGERKDGLAEMEFECRCSVMIPVDK